MRIPFGCRSLRWTLGAAALALMFGTQGEAVEAPDSIRQLMLKMDAAMKGIRSAECTFKKRVRPKNKLMPLEEMRLKSNTKGDVYIRWTGKRHHGREVLYRPAHHNGKLVYKAPVVNLKLDPLGTMAMAGNRHSIKEAGILFTTKRILQDVWYIDKHPDAAESYTDLGPRTVSGGPSHCFISVTPRANYKGFYTDKSEICIHDQTFLPTYMKNWEQQGEHFVLVEEFSWERCEINHLDEKDFDIENPQYGF